MSLLCDVHAPGLLRSPLHSSVPCGCALTLTPPRLQAFHALRSVRHQFEQRSGQQLAIS